MAKAKKRRAAKPKKGKLFSVDENIRVVPPGPYVDPRDPGDDELNIDWDAVDKLHDAGVERRMASIKAERESKRTGKEAPAPQLPTVAEGIRHALVSNFVTIVAYRRQQRIRGAVTVITAETADALFEVLEGRGF